jgi:acyl-CoA thioester hydrolase
MRVEEAWIDHNGHLNMAYYHVLLDRAQDEFFATFGIDLDYVRTRNASSFVLEDHVCYLRELKAGDPVHADVQILDHDARRVHLFLTLRHHDAGFLSATSEQLAIHVDMAVRKSAPWPADILARLRAIAEAHRALPRPERAGRSVGIARNAS